MSREVTQRQELTVRACSQVGQLLLNNFGRCLKIKAKADRDLVTNVDKKAEEIFIRSIKKCFPEDGIISEESPAVASASGYSWIIDPIDGTHNFIHNIAVFGTSVAVAYLGQVVLGVIYLPVSAQLYTAQRGRGAYRNGKKIAVSNRKLRESTIIYDSSIRFNKSKMLPVLGRIADQVFNLRMFGSTAQSLAYVAEGRAEAEVEFSDKLWDFAAGLLLVEEAGGRSTDFQGEPWNMNTSQYIASNGLIHKDLLQITRRV